MPGGDAKHNDDDDDGIIINGYCVENLSANWWGGRLEKIGKGWRGRERLFD